MIDFDCNAPVETWHAIPSVVGFELSNRLRVRRFVQGMYGTAIADGLPRDVTIEVTKTRGRPFFRAYGLTVYLHRIVWEVANGRRVPEGKVVRHWDDDPANNHPSNLLIGTQADNMRDAVRNQRHRRGESHPHAILDDEVVRAIHRLSAEGRSLSEIASRFGVSRGAISGVRSGRRWKHIG